MLKLVMFLVQLCGIVIGIKFVTCEVSSITHSSCNVSIRRNASPPQREQTHYDHLPSSIDLFQLLIAPIMTAPLKDNVTIESWNNIEYRKEEVLGH